MLPKISRILHTLSMTTPLPQFRDAYGEVVKAYNKKIDEAITAAIGTGQESAVSRVCVGIYVNRLRDVI